MVTYTFSHQVVEKRVKKLFNIYTWSSTETNMR